MSGSAPALRPLSEAPAAVIRGVPVATRAGVELFLVTREGTFDGRTFATGEVIVCRGETRSGDVTVLVARGHGRPRLGRVHGTRLLGDAGEPCLPERWRSAGPLVARYRHTAHGWVVELLEREEGVDDARVAGRDHGRFASGAGGAPATHSPAQLSLFAA